MGNGDVSSVLRSVLPPLGANRAGRVPQRLLTGSGDAPLSSTLHVSTSGARNEATHASHFPRSRTVHIYPRVSCPRSGLHTVTRTSSGGRSFNYWWMKVILRFSSRFLFFCCHDTERGTVNDRRASRALFIVISQRNMHRYAFVLLEEPEFPAHELLEDQTFYEIKVSSIQNRK